MSAFEAIGNIFEREPSAPALEGSYDDPVLGREAQLIQWIEYAMVQLTAQIQELTPVAEVQSNKSSEVPINEVASSSDTEPQPIKSDDERIAQVVPLEVARARREVMSAMADSTNTASMKEVFDGVSKAA